MEELQQIRNIVEYAWAQRDVAEAEVAALKEDNNRLKKDNEAMRHRLALAITSGAVRTYRREIKQKRVCSIL